MHITEIEQRFLEISGIECDLTKFPLQPEDIKNNIKVDKEKSDQYGEVFTPLWLVDKMILKATVEKLHLSKSTLDLCAGYGQFTIRMIRALANHDKDFDVYKWLKTNHTFIELQLESAYKLLYIFGVNINLLIGDALKVSEVRKWEGVSIYKHYWKEIPLDWVQKNIVNSEEEFVKHIQTEYLAEKDKVLTV
jgi:hypothetical protein